MLPQDLKSIRYNNFIFVFLVLGSLESVGRQNSYSKVMLIGVSLAALTTSTLTPSEVSQPTNTQISAVIRLAEC